MTQFKGLLEYWPFNHLPNSILLPNVICLQYNFYENAFWIFIWNTLTLTNFSQVFFFRIRFFVNNHCFHMQWSCIPILKNLFECLESKDYVLYDILFHTCLIVCPWYLSKDFTHSCISITFSEKYFHKILMLFYI